MAYLDILYMYYNLIVMQLGNLYLWKKWTVFCSTIEMKEIRNEENIENCIRNFHLQEECIKKLIKNMSIELITVVFSFVIWSYMYILSFIHVYTLIIN